ASQLAWLTQETCWRKSPELGAGVWTGCWVVQVRPFHVSISGSESVPPELKVLPAAKQWFRAGHETPMKRDGDRRSLDRCHLPPFQTSAKAASFAFLRTVRPGCPGCSIGLVVQGRVCHCLIAARCSTIRLQCYFYRYH